MMAWVARRRRADERGSILVLSVVGVILAVISTALAVDLGRLAEDKRTDQKVADLAALDASRDLTQACALAKASVVRNSFPASTLSCSDPATNPAGDVIRGKMVGGVFTLDPAGNAVQVKVHSAFKAAFPFVTAPSGLNVTAVGSSSPEAEFSVGSTLVSIDTNKSALDGVLGSMLGVSMNLVSYDGLASGNVSLGALKTKLVGLGYSFGSPDQLFTSSIKVSDLLTATAQVLGDQGNTLAKTQVNNIPILSIPATKTVKLGQLLTVSDPGSDSALAATLNVFQLVSGAVEIANGTNFISVPGVNATLPLGLGNISTSLYAIQAPQSAKGPVGVQAKTSQVKLRVHVDLLKTGALALLAPVSLDIDFSAGNATATLSSISCGTPPNIGLTATTNAAAVNLTGTILPPLVGTLSATGTVSATAPGAPKVFNYPTQFIPPVGPSPAFSQHVGAASLKLSPDSPLVVTGSGGLLAGTVALAVQGLLPTVFSTVDSVISPLLQPILKVLGLDIAAADLMAINIFPTPPACGQPGLIK